MQQKDYDSAIAFTEWKQGLMERGYIQISEDEAVSLPVDNYSILQDGTYWALPVQEDEEASTSLINNGDGTSSLIYTSGPRIGEVISEYGTLDLGDNTEAVADNAAIIDRSNSILALVDTIKNQTNDWNTGLVGTVSTRIPGTKAYNFSASVTSLKSLLTLDNLGIMKGALSDNDIKILSSAATALDLGMSKEAFIAEIDKISSKARSALANANSFNSVGSDTHKATLGKLAAIKENSAGGQCGRFVNNLTGLGLGDSYASKMAKMNPNIKTPAPGMVFVMPYKNYGHTGIILSVSGDYAFVKDSNWNLDEKVTTHFIKISSITGLKINKWQIKLE